ncbi:MAG: TolC family protein [Planctomycetes bacterium]|nr:TolC family protein [Planctomycetota bacterium]
MSWFGSAARSTTLLLAFGCSYPDLAQERERAAESYRAGVTERTRDLLRDGAPLTLQECERAALANNLDLQLACFDTAIARAQLGLEEQGQFPDLALRGTASWRSRRPYSRSEYLFGGGGIRDAFATGTPKENIYLTAELAWSPLDFGLACYSKMQASLGTEALEATERRVAQRLVTTVRAAYARTRAATAAQGLLESAVAESIARLDALRRQRESDLATAAEEAEARELVASKRELATQNARILDEARSELAAVMGIDPTATFDVADDPASAPPTLPPIAELVELALAHHPDLVEADATVEQARLEIEREWLKRFPNVELLASYDYDDNPFLLYDSWSRLAARVNVDLWSTLLGRGQDVAEARLEHAEADRNVVTMTIVLQIVRAHARLAEALAIAETARTAADSAAQREREFARQLEAGMREGLAYRKAKMDALVAGSKWLHARADVEAARGALLEAVGSDDSGER